MMVPVIEVDRPDSRSRVYDLDIRALIVVCARSFCGNSDDMLVAPELRVERPEFVQFITCQRAMEGCDSVATLKPRVCR